MSPDLLDLLEAIALCLNDDSEFEEPLIEDGELLVRFNGEPYLVSVSVLL